MKIVVDLTSLADNFTGMERYALNVIKEMMLADTDREHTYVLLFKKEVHPEFAEGMSWVKGLVPSVERCVYPACNKLIFNQIKLPMYLWSIKADAYFFPAFPSPLLFWNKNIYNVVFDLTCWDVPETMKAKARFFFRVTIKNALRVSRSIIVISEFTKKRVMEHFHYPESKITVAYCGISEVFRKAYQDEMSGEHKPDTTIREKLNLPEHYILCLGTLEPRKNLRMLVQAYTKLLQEQKLKKHLVLAGRCGWSMDEFLADVEAEHKNHIHITGFVEDKDLPQLYREADYFVFPSIYEGFGIPPLEAISVGCPVLSSDAASLPEVLGDMALYFKSADVEALKDALLKMEQGDDVKITDTLRSDAMQRFDWKHAGKAIGGVIWDSKKY